MARSEIYVAETLHPLLPKKIVQQKLKLQSKHGRKDLLYIVQERHLQPRKKREFYHVYFLLFEDINRKTSFNFPYEHRKENLSPGQLSLHRKENREDDSSSISKLASKDKRRNPLGPP